MCLINSDKLVLFRSADPELRNLVRMCPVNPHVCRFSLDVIIQLSVFGQQK